MRKRPKTYKFSEYASMEGGSPPVEVVSAHAREGGTLTLRRRGRPWGKEREELFQQKAAGVLAAVRSALAAGCTAAEIALVLGIPEEAVAEFAVEV